jgi:hypothetical protein
MADNQLARDGRTEFDLFPDDDPLSELARIVGYDNRPAVQQLQELERHRNSVLQEPDVGLEPGLGLEDELLREFESYGLTESVPPVEVGPAVVAEVAQPASPFDVDQPEVSPEPAGDGWDLAFEMVAENPSIVAENQSDVDVPVLEKPAFDALGADLERELELSIGYMDEAPLAVSVEAEKASDSIADGVSLEPVFEPALFEAAAPAVAVHEEPVAQSSFEPTFSPLAEAVSAPAAVAPAVDLVDELLADIERFPVPEKPSAVAAVPVAAVRKNNYPFTPMFSRATPVATNGGAGQKVYAAPIVAAAPAVVAMPSVKTAQEPIAEPVFAAQAAYVEEKVVAEPVVVAAAEALSPIAEPDFDLDAFELDLSDIDLDLDPVELEALERAEVSSAPVQQPVAVAKPQAAVAPEPLEIVEDAQPMVAPSRYIAPEPVVETPYALDEQSDGELPFDPTMIAEAEESLTAIAELDVPQLPVIEQEKPAVYQPDYELDIDAEMAQLFGAPSRSARNVEHGHDEHLFANVAQPAPLAPVANGRSRVEDDFDAFEKAMEEDFRQSLSPRQNTETVADDRLAVGSGYAADDYAEERRSSGVRRIALLAATVAGIAILGGAGVYAWMGDTAPGLSGGDPKVILADKSPVKIVPVEKGGKTVPNQDKAVYDRVAGAQTELPQQGTLVSSTEEPVDVVQRTLTPEDLPLEGRGEEALPGVTASDEDDRLMPDLEVAANNAAADDSTPAVSPRKVRTMIVKPDGTLVAREDVAPAADAGQVVAAAEPIVTPVKTSTITPDVQAGAVTAQPQRSALAEAADVTVEETAPVRPVSTTAVTETAALPQARPATEQPAAEQTASTPKVETPAPVQTTTVAPGSYVVQIASLPSEGEAQKSYNSLSGKFGSVIGGRGVDIKKAEIAGKGTYYRVRIPAGSKQEANELCARYKSAGGSCLVTR